MTKGYVQAEIDKIKGVADYNIKLTTELDTEDESKAPPAKATRKEKKKKAKKQDCLNYSIPVLCTLRRWRMRISRNGKEEV